MSIYESTDNLPDIEEVKPLGNNNGYSKLYTGVINLSNRSQLKVLIKPLAQSSTQDNGPSVTALTFHREAEITDILNSQNFQHCPRSFGIMKVIINGIGQTCFVREWFEHTLEEKLNDAVNSTSAIGSVVNLLSELAKAIDAFHRIGLIHCDIDEKHFFIDNNGKIVLADFGYTQSAKKLLGRDSISLDSINPLDEYFINKPNRTSPEVSTANPIRISKKADIYSFAQIVNEWISKPMGQALSDDIKSVINKSLDVSPANRHNTCIALMEEITPLLQRSSAEQ